MRRSLNVQTRTYEILAMMAIDTYEAVQDLKWAGFTERQAAALVAVIRWAVTWEYTSYSEWFFESGIGGAADREDVVMQSVAEDS